MTLCQWRRVSKEVWRLSSDCVVFSAEERRGGLQPRAYLFQLHIPGSWNPSQGCDWTPMCLCCRWSTEGTPILRRWAPLSRKSWRSWVTPTPTGWFGSPRWVASTRFGQLALLRTPILGLSYETVRFGSFVTRTVCNLMAYQGQKELCPPVWRRENRVTSWVPLTHCIISSCGDRTGIHSLPISRRIPASMWKYQNPLEQV